MSHASLLVITDQEPTEAILGPLLQPWHEFECTGTDDQYVQDLDVTAKLREEFAEQKRRMIRDEAGELVCAYDARFYRDPTPEETAKIGRVAGTGFGHGLSWTSSDWGDGRGYRAKIRYIPEGCSEVEVPAGLTQTFVAWIEGWSSRKPVKYGRKPDLSDSHKYGYVLLGPDGEVVKVVNRTNPNKKWDYWVVGGRYADRLIPLGDPAARLNVCRRDRLDLAAMKELQVAERQKWAQECCTQAKGTMDELDVACRVATHVHATWETLPEPRPRGQEFYAWVEATGIPDWLTYSKIKQPNWELPEPAPNQSVFDWIEAAPPLSSWAVVMDNQWFEKGKMAWWGMSSDDKANWEDHFNDLFSLIRDDQWICVVDYHI